MRLDAAAVDQFRTRGYFSPVDVLEPAEVAGLRRQLQAAEAAQGGKLHGTHRIRAYLPFRWVYDLIHDPRVLDPVEQLIGPDILCWNVFFWIKEPGSKSFISWHQDTTYWGLSSDKVVTAWLALSEASERSGCMRVMPGTHRGEVLAHEDTFDEHNLLTRGQSIVAGIDEARAVSMPLAAGQMSMHNYRLAHASGPNHGDDRRIGVSMHFMPPDTRQIVGDWDAAVLVRGRDGYGHFESVPEPDGDLDPTAMAFHKRLIDSTLKVLYHGAAQGPRT
ncbi:MAG: phytanoyl-CoA dioxygenase family protein [Burkholderiaceae bacterium]